MALKRGKLTAGKARERVASLEESISARQHRLDQLNSRLDRSDTPDERLVTAKSRLERRLALEREQLDKLRRLLGRDHSPPEESGEFFVSEEIDTLHRSFESVRQDLAQVQARLDSSELPRDLNHRLSSFEERVARREEIDSDLFARVLSLQTALDEERQAIRRQSRRLRDQEQNLDALREAVEDSVVATVDLAERLDELEEGLGEMSTTGSARSEAESSLATEALAPRWEEPLAELRQQFQAALAELQQWQSQNQPWLEDARRAPEAAERRLNQLQAELDDLRQRLESLAALQGAPAEAQAEAPVEAILERLQRLETQGLALAQAVAASSVAPPSAPSPALRNAPFELQRPDPPRQPAHFSLEPASRRSPAVFAQRHPSRRTL